MTELDWFNKLVEKSRDLILKEAFKLFLQRNIEKVTVPELERTTKLQRGAIFYHFKDKEAIFREVVEKYFFSSLNIFYPLPPDDGINSLKGYWDKRNEHLTNIQSWFIEEETPINPYSAFFHLAGQANLYIPTFGERMTELIDTDKQSWKAVAMLDNWVKRKKVDSDMVGNMYRSIYIEQCHIACYNKDGFSCPCPNILEF